MRTGTKTKDRMFLTLKFLNENYKNQAFTFSDFEGKTKNNPLFKDTHKMIFYMLVYGGAIKNIGGYRYGIILNTDVAFNFDNVYKKATLYAKKKRKEKKDFEFFKHSRPEEREFMCTNALENHIEKTDLSFLKKPKQLFEITNVFETPEVQDAIFLLKNLGCKIMKSVQNFEEI